MTGYFDELRRCLRELEDKQGEIDHWVSILHRAKFGGHIYIMGNGGSATTASHFARDLKIGCRMPHVECLNDSMATITSLGNDVNYSQVFARQVEYAEFGDVLIGISCSGKSPNILEALRVARCMKMGMIGFGGGDMQYLCNKSIILSSNQYGPVEDVHSVICHMIKEKLCKLSL